jgi:GntR family transcriptional regulator, rspAB operon transcriptional repressor
MQDWTAPIAVRMPSQASAASLSAVPHPIASTRPAPLLAAAPLDRRRPLRDQIYEIIRNRILTVDLAPGDLIDEKAIAASLAVSRTPVREAVKKLCDENLVIVRAQSATLVAPIDRRLIHEAFLIRRALEVESVGQAAALILPSDVKALRSIHDQHRRAIRLRQFVAAIGHDDAFHRTIAMIADLPLLWRAIDVSKAHLDRCRHLTVPRDGAGQATLDQHGAVLTALAVRDVNGARTAMTVHLDSAYAIIQAFLDQQASAD